MCTYFVQVGEVPEDGENGEMADSKTKRRRSFCGKNRFRWPLVQLAFTESSQAESENKVTIFWRKHKTLRGGPMSEESGSVTLAVVGVYLISIVSVALVVLLLCCCCKMRRGCRGCGGCGRGRGGYDYGGGDSEDSGGDCGGGWHFGGGGGGGDGGGDGGDDD